MVLFFLPITAIVMLIAFLRARKEKNSAMLVVAAIIFLLIVCVFGMTFDALDRSGRGKLLIKIDIAAAVVQLGLLAFTLLKTNAITHNKVTKELAAELASKDEKRSAEYEKYRINGINHRFLANYAPYRIEGFVIPVRKFEDIPLLDPDNPMLRNMALAVDERRNEDPYAGAKIAAQEIFINLTNWLKTDRGVHAETLLATLGSIGGRECMRGIMTTLKSFSIDVDLNSREGSVLITDLMIMIAETKDGEKFLLGDRVASEFGSFYMTAACDNSDPIEKLRPIAAHTTACIGSEDFWKTPFDELVGKSPKEIADMFDGKFDVTFGTYCRFPHERMMAVAIAAQTALKELGDVMPKETAMSVLLEFGWRTSHYIGKEI